MDFVRRLIRQDIQQLSAYAVPDATGLTKLDAMENPYPAPDIVQQQWQSLADLPINRYPDPGARALTAAIKQSLNTDQAILLGNGSDEIILHLCIALAAGSTVLSTGPSFVMYQMIAMQQHLRYIEVDLQADFSLDLPVMLDTVLQQQPSLIFLACPNNPTGNLFDRQAVEQIIQAADGLIVIDEAYTAFAETSYIDLLGQYDNVLVMRTLSKLGLAGLRLGYAVAHPALIHELDKVRMPYNINRFTQAAALIALQHASAFNEQAELICQQRTRLINALEKVFQVFSTQTNFVLVKTQSGQAGWWFEQLLKHGILIKNMHGKHALLTDCLRITVGTDVENSQLLSVIKQLQVSLS